MLKRNVADPFISIVTPSFNQTRFIGEAIKSVERQNYINYEHLIVDGMSTDGTVDVLKKLDSRKFHIKWTSEIDSGQSAALNKGFGWAKGDIIGWLNSDDFYKDNCFDQIIKAFIRYPDVDIIYGDYELVDENGDSIQLRREMEFSNFTLFYHRVLYIATIATFFRRRVFDEANWINEDLHYAMDLDFLMRLSRKGYVIKHINVALASYRLQPESKTCSHSAKFGIEHRKVVCVLIPLLRRLRYQWAMNIVIFCGRLVAAYVRYAEKLLRGYYWSTWRTKYIC